MRHRQRLPLLLRQQEERRNTTNVGHHRNPTGRSFQEARSDIVHHMWDTTSGVPSFHGGHAV